MRPYHFLLGPTCLVNVVVSLDSRQSILHWMHSSPMKIVHDAVSKAQYLFSYFHAQWRLTLRHSELLVTSEVSKKTLFPLLKFFLNKPEPFGCSLFTMLVCRNAPFRRIMFVLKSLNFFEYNCWTHVRWPMSSSPKCTYKTFNELITLRSTHSPCLKVDLPNL
jgi:hypothetical protein